MDSAETPPVISLLPPSPVVADFLRRVRELDEIIRYYDVRIGADAWYTFYEAALADFARNHVCVSGVTIPDIYRENSKRLRGQAT